MAARIPLEGYRALAFAWGLACLALCPWAVRAQGSAPARYSVAKTVEFHPGNPKAQAMLSRIKDLRELVAERFAVAMIDLNDDGRAEIVVQSASGSFCGSGGGMTMVVGQQGNRMVTLLTQNLDSALGITQEKVGGPGTGRERFDILGLRIGMPAAVGGQADRQPDRKMRHPPASACSARRSPSSTGCSTRPAPRCRCATFSPRSSPAPRWA